MRLMGKILAPALAACILLSGCAGAGTGGTSAAGAEASASAAAGSAKVKKLTAAEAHDRMDTPLSRVGLTEREARENNLPVRVVKLPTAAVPKAQVLRRTEGFLKAVIHAETGKILGAALLCPESYEMINTVKLAMDLGADYTVLRDQIFTHPTMSEALNDLFAL